jgi:phenylacetate-CoA ligase
MKLWELPDLVRHVRRESPFYRRLYQDLPEGVSSIAALPPPTQEEYWKANMLAGNQLLTGPLRDGIVFKSGGTTGRPKFSVFAREEWELFCETFGRGIAATGLRAGDRVANLFCGGELYGSFLLITKSLEKSPTAVMQLPIGGAASVEETLRLMRDFDANVVAGVPTTIMNLVEHVAASGANPREFGWERVLFGGECLYDDQRARLAEVFPSVTARSIGYASTDAGLLGYADLSCGPNEHRVFGRDTIVEILDEVTLKPIEEQDREGLIHVTSLGRSLMPVLRYPVGDRGAWREQAAAKDRRFVLLGRADEAARVGLVKLYVDDVRRALADFRAEFRISDFQMIVVHHDLRDGLVLRLSADDAKGREGAAERIVAELHRARPLYLQFVREAKIHPIRVEWARPGELETHPRTGRLRRVVDRRGSAARGA